MRMRRCICAHTLHTDVYAQAYVYAYVYAGYAYAHKDGSLCMDVPVHYTYPYTRGEPNLVRDDTVL